jgi:ribulose-phosphate 3-epimerase
MILSPSLLSADFTRLGEQIAALEAAGTDWLHFDVMDGHFAPNLSMGPGMVATCRAITPLPLDVHLMIANPAQFIEAFAKAGANWITVHIEADMHIYRTLQAIRALGCRPGVALNPGTPTSALGQVLPLVDMVLVLGSNPGFSGQAFIPAMLPKVSEIRALLDAVNPSAMIQVDGGMTAETLPQAQSAGANVFVAGNAIFKHPQGIAAGVQVLKGCCL